MKIKSFEFLEEKNYAKAVALAEKGIAADRKDKPGLAAEWKWHLLNVYQLQNDSEKSVELARNLFLYSGRFSTKEMYNIMKKYVPAADWKVFFEQLVADRIKSEQWVSFYTIADMYTWENQWEKLLSLLIRELIWQKLQHIGRPSFARLHSLLLRLHDSISEESHLAVQVILLAPAHKLLYLGFPLATIRHIEHASLQIGNDIGSEREVLVNPVLAHTGKVGILLFQLLCQGESLRAIDSTRSHVKMLDIGF